MKYSNNECEYNCKSFMMIFSTMNFHFHNNNFVIDIVCKTKYAINIRMVCMRGILRVANVKLNQEKKKQTENKMLKRND